MLDHSLASKVIAKLNRSAIFRLSDSVKTCLMAAEQRKRSQFSGMILCGWDFNIFDKSNGQTKKLAKYREIRVRGENSTMLRVGKFDSQSVRFGCDKSTLNAVVTSQKSPFTNFAVFTEII